MPIERMECIAADHRRYMCNAPVGSIYYIPKDFKTVRIYHSIGRCYEFEVEFIKKISENGPLTQDEAALANLFKKLNVCYEFSEKSPELNYQDITEHEMFGFHKITQSELIGPDSGMWTFFGLRKIQFTVKNAINHVNMSERLGFYFNRRDNEEIDVLRMDRFTSSFDQNDGEYRFYSYLDTNIIGNYFNADNPSQLFSGYVEISFETTNGLKDNWNHKVVYAFPIKINFFNTQYIKERGIKPVHLKDDVISIDFGTSSTCVAIGSGTSAELLTLSHYDHGEDDDGNEMNQYENPTCVMIYRWDEFINQWKHDNAVPIIVKKDKQNNIKTVEYDFGYSVKDLFNEVNDNELNAIVSELKMIHYHLGKGEQLTIRPCFAGNKEVVYLSDSPEAAGKSDERLDPVALYGYIIGRAINNITDNRIYTRFNITYPVKFDITVRNKILHSLEYGLSRSLPLPLRQEEANDLFSVNMSCPEPVAFIGAMCGKYLKIDVDSPEAKLFAVYDLGGGTLDYSFGMMYEDMENEGFAAIRIFSIDGTNSIGGESLISMISFKIYVENAGVMIQNDIPFCRPDHEKIPGIIPNHLISYGAIAKTNVRKINEAISRKIFEDTANCTGAISKSITLYNINREPVTVKITINYEPLKATLKEAIASTISHFHSCLEDTLTKNIEYIYDAGITDQIDNVFIFKAGNASKNVYVNELMKSTFQNNKVQLVDETNEKLDYLHTALTPKTAVAFGLSRLQSFDVFLPEELPYSWYIGSVNPLNNTFIIRIHRTRHTDEWVDFGPIRDSFNTKIYYSDIDNPDQNGTQNQLHDIRIPLNADDVGKRLYIRPVRPSSVAYCACYAGEISDMNEMLNDNHTILLT